MRFTIDVFRAIFPEYRLKKNGTFGKINGKNSNVIAEDDFTFDSLSEGEKWKREQKFIEVEGEKIEVNPTTGRGLGSYYVSVEPHRIRKPKQNFITKDQLKTTLIQGDDSVHNSLIIDFDGFLHLLPFEQAKNCPYAVRYESFQAGNGYVGSDSGMSHLDRTYLALLQGWSDHLASSKQIYRDYADNESEEEVVKEILGYLEQYV